MKPVTLGSYIIIAKGKLLQEIIQSRNLTLKDK